MNTKSLGAILVTISAIFVSAESVTVKLCYSANWNYFSLMTFRFLFGFMIMSSLALFMKKRLLLTKENLKFGTILALLHVSISSLLYIAFDLLPAATAILFFYCYPVFTAIVAYFLEKERLSFVTLISLVLVIGGVVVFSGSVWGDINVLGVTVALICAVLNSIFFVLLARFLRKGADPITFTNYTFMTGFVIFSVISLSSGNLVLPSQAISWAYMLFLALAPTCVAILLFNMGVKRTGATLGAIIYGLEVPVSALYAFLIFGDTWQPLQILGAVMIISAVLLPNIWQNQIDRINFKLLSTKKDNDSTGD